MGLEQTPGYAAARAALLRARGVWQRGAAAAEVEWELKGVAVSKGCVTMVISGLFSKQRQQGGVASECKLCELLGWGNAVFYFDRCRE
jgi:hypothetical protein